ncbi:short chain dehydrogenase (AtsC) [Sporothrix schenckii 1099-18]|uniref:Short chain dehydrogenase (AtsC) n=1 Tax=Sporothrix schenckii 1099-18 TaxID=1397361 RepID=A0A0F2M8N6_SPOSC|nr:short chain dehydrogenase (AtsC) [Sporothrix schenckii 1099-18]KJR86058.1 short chain dehydrogenase (AtsC) [Sporothrix schenckii 1099-18]
MSSWVITGVSRGLGFEFVRQLSDNPSNTVFGLVRDKAAVESKIAAEIGRKNIHIIQADTTDPAALEKAVQYISHITNGTIDYVIANAALQAKTALVGFDTLSHDSKALEQDLIDHFRVNTIGAVHLFNAFMPLVLKGRAKKVIAISTGMSDPEMTLQADIYQATSYAITKAALNMAIAKFSAVYREKGVLCMAICPGAVDTGSLNIETEEEGQLAMAMFGKFKQYSPSFQGPARPEDSAKSVLALVKKATIDDGYAGIFLSHTESKPYL